jgi:hypothetical protein
LSVLVAAGVARAEPPVQIVTLPTLFVGVSGDHELWQRTLDDRIEAGIRHSGRGPRLPGPLTGAELGCRDASCMARIAESNEGSFVLGARVTADRGSPPSFKIMLVRFDRRHPETVEQVEVECSVCTQAEVADALEHTVASMLAPPPTPTPVVPTPPVATVETPPAPHGPKRSTMLALIGGTSALGVVGVVMLGVGGRGLAINGSPSSAITPPATEAPRLYDTKGAGAGLVATGTIVTLGALIGLGFEIAALRHSR